MAKLPISAMIDTINDPWLSERKSESLEKMNRAVAVTADSPLPAGFEDLTPLVTDWDMPTFEERWARRSASSMIELQAFYDAMLPRSEAALALAAQYPIDAMPDPVARLFRLCLALVSASMSIEIQRSVRVPFSPYPHAARCLRGPAPWG